MASHRISILFSIAYILLSLVAPCLSCGGLVHGEVAQRAKYLFTLKNNPVNGTESVDKFSARVSQWLQRYESSVLAGMFMPDWGYGCAGADDLAEAMHWPPFLKAGVEYLRETYPDYTNERAQSLAAFLIAVSGHQVQDAAWHSIGLLMGFIDEVAKIDCKESFAAAHETLDWGGDTLFGRRFGGHQGSSDWAFGDWLAPVDDLVKIYERMDMTISGWQLKWCSLRLRSVLIAAARGSSLLFDRYAHRSPFMLDHFDDYYLGGIDDMTFTTVECWNRLVDWFRPGSTIPEDPWSLCPLTQAITRRTDPPVHCIPDAVRKDLKSEADEAEKYIHGEDEGGNFRLWYDGPRDLNSDIVLGGPEDKNPSQSYTGTFPYARFGMSMAAGDFGIGNPAQIAVSAPYETREYDDAYLGDVHVLSLDGTTASSIRTSPPLSHDFTGMRFGWSLAAFKVPLRNLSALAVGVPGYHNGGIVFVYAGSALNSLQHKLTIMPYRAAEHRSNYGKRYFGTKLFVADVDGDGKEDLLISSPWADFTNGELLPNPSPPEGGDDGLKSTWSRDQQHGSVAVFTGKQLEMMVDGRAVHDEDCAYYISPPLGDGWERFGTSIAYAKQSRVLLVGAPGWSRNSTTSGRGKVYGVRVTPEERSIVFQIDGPVADNSSLPTEFGGGGLTTGITSDGDEWVAISAHNTKYNKINQAGLIHIYTLKENLTDTNNVSISITHVVTLQAEEPGAYDKFGAVTESDGKDTLWISSGWANEESGLVWSYNVRDGISKSSERKVMSFLHDNFQHVFRNPEEDYEVAKVFARGDEPKARFGDSMIVGDLNGDGIVDIAVGSPFSFGRDEESPLAGKIDIFLNKNE